MSAILTWFVWFRPVKTAEEEKKPEAEVPVHVAKISRATMRSYVTAYGIVEPEPNAAARVAVSVAGVVAAVDCVEGQHVERGTLLFELDGRAVEVTVKFAEKSLARQTKLAEAEGPHRSWCRRLSNNWQQPAPSRLCCRFVRPSPALSPK